MKKLVGILIVVINLSVAFFACHTDVYEKLIDKTDYSYCAATEAVKLYFLAVIATCCILCLFRKKDRPSLQYDV